MAIMKWTDNLSVHVQEIDTQHQKLIALINDLHDAMLARKGKEVLGDILDQLAAYTVYHFNTEEKYMQDFSYSGYLLHKKEHDSFVGKIDALITDYNAGKVGLSIDLMAFLRDWVQNHIQGTDKKYSETFNKNGLI